MIFFLLFAVTAAVNGAPGTTTLRPTVIPNQNCVSSSMNIYLNYFFDTGNAHLLFDLYYNIVQNTSIQQAIGNPTRWLSIYGANANGTTPSPIPFSQLDSLQYQLFSLFNPPFYTSMTSSIIDDLTFYSSVLNAQLTYPATPVVVMFLNNPIDDVSASIAKMNAVKNASPKTYFMGVLLSSDPTIAQLPFDFTLNITVADNTAPKFVVDQIMTFICTVTPPSF
uniref:Secreted protein n=1 Tax=Panagrolaimus sp. ES5 TaxID=591445 RepID=A0AC34F724_9BILA